VLDDRKSSAAELKVDGWRINITGMDELKGRMVDALASDSSSFMICPLNLDVVAKLRGDAKFRKAYARARFVSADGFPIVTLARLAGFHIERTTGADAIKPICSIAAQKDLPIFLVGSSLGTLCASGSSLVKEYPGLDIRGVFAPPRGFDPQSPLADEIIEIVGRSGARICFVAFGAPRQELFANRAIEKTTGICFLAIGAGLDFISGAQRRAPKIFQRLNMEWLWRLALNPARLSGRYSLCAVVFAQLVFKHFFSSSLLRNQNA
jgi:N-acetylglucosaminyldiphosphoundecaprenol N-acetyl-beta-D-mannosaminyltransferase